MTESTATTCPTEPGPERRAWLTHRGWNISPDDFSDDEKAEIDAEIKLLWGTSESEI